MLRITDALSIPYLPLEGVFRYLYRKCPDLIFGGHSDNKEAFLADVWSKFEPECPDHAAFRELSEETLVYNIHIHIACCTLSYQLRTPAE